MRYVNARLEQEDRDFIYRIFVTKSLQLIPQSRYLSKEYYEVLQPQNIDHRTGDEIAADIILRAELSFKEENDDCI